MSNGRDLYQEHGVAPNASQAQGAAPVAQDQTRDLYAEHNVNPNSSQNTPANLGLFDPSNQTSTGGYVPSGTYDQPYARDASTLVANAFMPGSTMLSRILGGTALNAGINQLDPDNKLGLGQSLGINALFNSAIEGLPWIGKGISKVAQNFMPQQAAEKIMGWLGQGAGNLEENNQSLAKDIYDAHKTRVDQASAAYDPVLERYGDKNIYPESNPSGIYLQTSANKPNLDFLSKDSDMKDTVNDFNKNSTFENAHDLQSAMGVKLGKLMKENNPLNNDMISELATTRSKIKNDMDDYVRNVSSDPEMANQYNLGSELFRQNVVPFRSDATLEAIARGRETNPKNIHNIFDYPTGKIDVKTQENVMGPIEKVMQDLPQQAQGKILYSKLGNLNTKLTPEKLNAALSNARNSGYSQYFSPELENMIDQMNGKVTARNTAEHLLGGIMGSVGGHLIGPGAEGIAGAAGAYLGPKVINPLTSLIPGHGLSNEATNVISQLYRPVARTASVNAFNQNQ